MAPSTSSARPPVTVADVLNGLLEAETGSIFHFLAETRPYLNRASASLRQPLKDMVAQSDQHARELSDLIESLGGVPVLPHVVLEEQYLTYLSFPYLLPKLLAEKQRLIHRYESALAAIPDAPAAVVAFLQNHLLRHRLDEQWIIESSARQTQLQ